MSEPSTGQGSIVASPAFCDRLQAYLRDTGRRATRVGDTFWINNGGVVWPWTPPLYEVELPPDGGRGLLRTLGGYVAWWGRPLPDVEDAPWYEVVLTRHVELGAMKSKLRNKFRNSLNAFRCDRLGAEDADAIYAVYQRRQQEYDVQHSGLPSPAEFRARFDVDLGYADVVHYWGVWQDDELVGFSKNYVYDDVWVSLNTTKILQSALKKRALYGLLHRMSEYYFINNEYKIHKRRGAIDAAWRRVPGASQARFRVPEFPLLMERAYRYPLVTAAAMLLPPSIVDRSRRLGGLARFERVYRSQAVSRPPAPGRPVGGGGRQGVDPPGRAEGIDRRRRGDGLGAEGHDDR